MLVLGVSPALAAPLYLTDDPESTDYQHFEINNFTNGTATRANSSGEAGIDINYGGAPNLQLTATVPAAYSVANGDPLVGGFGTVELAAKYRFLTQQNFGLDVAVFPTVFLPSGTANVGVRHVSYDPVYVIPIPSAGRAICSIGTLCRSLASSERPQVGQRVNLS